MAVLLGLLLFSVYSALTVDCTRAQDCNEVINVTSADVTSADVTSAARVDLLVNRSISPYCLQCLDGNMMPRSDAQWVLPGGRIVTSTDPSPEAVVVNGVLVLLDPMTLLMDGPNSYRVECKSSAFVYTNINLYSSTLLPPDIDPPLRMVTEGDNVEVSCNNPNPTPLVQAVEQWFDPNGNRALADFNTLTIPNITRIQAGDYQCVLTSIRNETLDAFVTIIVQYAPTVTSEGPTLVKLQPSTSVTLSCGFTGLPLPDVTWSRDGVPTGPEGDVLTTGNRSELTVREVTREREGMYRCSASNSVGTSSLEFTVQILPGSVIGLTTSASDTTVILRWTYQSSGTSPRVGAEVELWRDGARVNIVTVGPAEFSTTFSSLQPLTRYTLTVYVLTAVGRSEPASVNTTTLSLRLPQPTEVEIIPVVCGTELVVTWQPPIIMPNTTDPITGWTLELSLLSGDGIQRVTQDDPQVTTATFRGLETDTEYRVRVAGKNSRGTGLFSDTATTRTVQNPGEASARTSGFSRDVGVALIAVIVVLMTALVVTPAVLVCLFKHRLQRMKTGQATLHPDPASLTPCAAYGVSKGSTLEAEYEAIGSSTKPGGGSVDPDYEMPTIAATNPRADPEYERILPAAD